MTNYDLIVVGSGPGGYVAAIRASQLGMSVAVIEKAELGGVCLNWGCIPTKSLLKSAQVLKYAKHAHDYGVVVNEATVNFSAVIERSRGISAKMSKGVEFLMKKNKITVIPGRGKLVSHSSIEVEHEGSTSVYQTKHIILATGARSKELPSLKQDGQRIINYRQALSLPECPKSMIVVGSGAIGSELAYFYSTMGTKVTIIEYMPTLLPIEDEEVSKQVGRSFKKAGIEVMTRCAVEEGIVDERGVTVKIRNKKGEIEERYAEIVLSAAGVVPNIENIGIEEIGIETERGKIKVDDYYRTSCPGVYAIGDIVHGPALAHVASAEAICCVEAIAGLNPHPINYDNIPGCTYTSPEVASVGLTEAKAKESGYVVKVGKFPFTASGKATSAGATEGFIKIISNEENGRILGAHLVGENVTELISEVVLARQKELTMHDIVKTIHPHPTLSEAIMEAAAVVLDEGIHI